MAEKYKELSKLYHADSSSSRDANLAELEKQRRFADSTFHIDFWTNAGELFIAVPRELSLLSEEILRAERRISSLIKQMPGIASGAVLRSLVLDEVVSTNSIEDVHSTRREIKNALETQEKDEHFRRFKELALLYFGIVEETASLPKSCEDIRAIYDRVMANELDKETLPDGKLFRANEVHVVSGGGARVLHSGLAPEEKITDAMKRMLALLASDEIPLLYSAIAAHFIFEYAHPFYDGNGRTGRYLLSLSLNEALSKPTVLSLSRAIAENRDAYYRAFKTVENPLNRGELTFFVLKMLELVRHAQDNTLTRLVKNQINLGTLREMMGTLPEAHALKKQEEDIVFMLMQYEAFGFMGDAPLDDIAQHLGISPQMARKHVRRLEDKGVLVKCKPRKPLTFGLSDAFKEECGFPLE